MRLPFCEQCVIADRCTKDHELFLSATGNLRIPPESFCRAQYERAGVDIGDFYRNVMVNAVENPTCLYPVFPELKEQVEQLEQEWRSARAEERQQYGTGTDSEGGSCGEPKQEEFALVHKLPFSVTLMLTEKCNLACEYCYERFSGNNQPKTMSRAVIYQSIQQYLTHEMLATHPYLQWDLIGGEVFVEFDLLKYAVNTILARYKELRVCPKKIALSLCTNGTHFHRPEVREWLLSVKERVGSFDVGLSLDGVKECHDLCRNNSHDRVMEHFDWWRESFPNSGIKGTLSPKTMKYLYQNVLFYVEEAKLPRFYCNPTFEGPWTDEDATLYGEELIKCAEYFLKHHEYNVFENSNLFAPVHIRMKKGPRQQNWCGCGTHMRAIDVDGRIFPCLRAVTSNLAPIGTLAGGIDTQKLVPFYLYTQYNEDTECAECDVAPYCPSCAMQWMENTGDLYCRSKTLCTMTRVRHRVSQWYFEQSDAGKKLIAEWAEQDQRRKGGGEHGYSVE